MFSAHTWPVERAAVPSLRLCVRLRSSFETPCWRQHSRRPKNSLRRTPGYRVAGPHDGQGDEQSLADTANLSVGDLTDKEAEELRALTSAYREVGHPLVICVDNVVDLAPGIGGAASGIPRPARLVSPSAVIRYCRPALRSTSPTRAPCAPRGTRG